MEEVHMKYLGIDFHKNYSLFALMDQEGNILTKRKVNNTREEYKNILKPYNNIKAVVEACRSWGVCVDLIEDLVEEVVLAHPYKTRAIAEARIKTDSIDAETLGHLLRSDFIAEAYLRDKNNRGKQRVLRNRCFLIKLRTQIKNRIHSVIDMQREEIREGAKVFSDLFGKGGREWLMSIELPEPDGVIMKQLLGMYGYINETIKQSEQLVKEIMKNDEDCKLLKSIPGIGDFFSVLVKVEVGDINRFRNASKLCSYAGLVPSTYASGGKVWNGRITKNGNKWLRTAMVEAVIPAISSNMELKRYYERIKYNKGAKAAKVAAARRLLCIVYRVLKEKDTFKLNKRELTYKGVESPSISPSAVY
jgi:transposase